jgi:hypothetical protein
MSATRNDRWCVVGNGQFLCNREIDPVISKDDLADLLDEAAFLGFDLGPNSPIENLTVGELVGLVRGIGSAN